MTSLSLFAIALGIIFEFSSVATASNDADIGTVIEVFRKLVDILLNEQTSLDVDIAVGLMVAYQNLDHISHYHPWSNQIQLLKANCQLLIERFFVHDVGDHVNSAELIPPLSNLTLWKRMVNPLHSLSWRREQRFHFIKPDDDSTDLGRYSDDCILSIFQNKCFPTRQCWMERNGVRPSSVALLHFLLFLQLRTAFGCDQVLTHSWHISYIHKKVICRQFLLSLLVTRPQSVEELDIALESIVLCGAIEGYVDFGSRIIQEMILSYHNRNGCFDVTNLKYASLKLPRIFTTTWLNSMLIMTSVPNNNIKEGQAEILVQPNMRVFYNNVQQFNRDLSICVISLWVQKYLKNNSKVNPDGDDIEKIRVFEALSATGLRSIRYAKEIEGLSEIIANDISEAAVENIKANIAHNGVDNLVQTSHNDAIDVMFNSRHVAKRFHVIDLDPYGHPTQFLDTAVQAVVDGGLLLVTCTDMAVLCGNTPESCYVNYGATSLRVAACHEMALRIVLQCIEAHANRYKRYIVPLLSISADFYVRVFVQIFSSAVKCKSTTSKLSMVHECVGCGSLTLQPLGVTKARTKSDGKPMPPKYFLPHSPAVSCNCLHCGSKHRLGGPIWSAPIHDPAFVTDLLTTVADKSLGTQKRLEGVLSVIREELHEVPLYYTLDKLCSKVHTTSMPMMTFRSALLNAGFKVSFSHAHKTSIKTTAPVSVLWDIVRSWAAKNPPSEKKINADPVAKFILSVHSTTTVEFSLRPDANPISREMKLVRYQENPLPFWGPGTRASINADQPTKKKQNRIKKRRSENQVDSGEEPEKKILETNTCEP